MKSCFSSLVWIRRDLRVKDNPALSFASRIPGNTAAVFIQEAQTSHSKSKDWQNCALSHFASQLQEYNIPLFIYQGNTLDVLTSFIKKHHIQHLCWNDSYDPEERSIENTLKKTIEALSIESHHFQPNFLFDLDSIKTKQGNVFQVFTPFYNCVRPLLEQCEEAPLPQKQKFQGQIKTHLSSMENWIPSEMEAWKRTKEFIKNSLSCYITKRELLAESGTSRLSPYLHFGQISIRSLVNELLRSSSFYEPFLRQLIWREFAAYLLLHFPHTVTKPLRKQFLNFSWRYNTKELEAWKNGCTGIPIVDAAMRELITTGWMHNRARMIVASFLTKHLLHSWTQGSEYFMEKLYDADLANNTFGWQWTAGSGADAAPFFRIFNPVLQGKKFDKEGTYIRRFVPELMNVPTKYIHAPWEAPTTLLQECHVQLGTTYPFPLITLDAGRKRALSAFSSLCNT